MGCITRLPLDIPTISVNTGMLILHVPTISVNTCMYFYIYLRFLSVLVCNFTYTNYVCRYLYVMLHIPMISVGTCILFYIYQLFMSVFVCYFT